MPDARFHRRLGPFTLGELAQKTGLFRVPEGVDPSMQIRDALPLEQAGDGDLSFLDNRKYLPALAETRAQFCVITPELADRAPAATIVLSTPHPYLAFAMVSQALSVSYTHLTLPTKASV